MIVTVPYDIAEIPSAGQPAEVISPFEDSHPLPVLGKTAGESHPEEAAAYNTPVFAFDGHKTTGKRLSDRIRDGPPENPGTPFFELSQIHGNKVTVSLQSLFVHPVTLG